MSLAGAAPNSTMLGGASITGSSAGTGAKRVLGGTLLTGGGTAAIGGGNSAPSTRTPSPGGGGGGRLPNQVQF